MNTILSSRTSSRTNTSASSKAVLSGSAVSGPAVKSVALSNRRPSVPAVVICAEYPTTHGQPQQAKHFWLPTELPRSCT